jgi:Fe-S cluster biogenesis protein NfuA
MNVANPDLIAIRAEPGADPTSCRLVVDRVLNAGPSAVISAQDADREGSPLLKALFAIEGVTQVMVAGDTVTLQKMGGADWPIAAKQAGQAIREFLGSGQKFVAPERKTATGAADSSLVARVEHILKTQVNPGVAGHGGKIELIEIRGATAYLKMSGGCQGCGAAKVTLKQGVEKTLLAQLPEIREVVDVTDHSAGSNPFYRS